MYRDFSKIKLSTSHYLIIVLIFIFFNYYCFVYHYLQYEAIDNFNLSIGILIIFHIFFFMTLWSLVRSVVSDPGQVPVFWGFFMDDPESKKRRYCLICHIFKPERCHHCSTCARCVLNMDHHCPWINNCVGFHNRKFFMLMLFYINLTTLTMILAETKQFVTIFAEGQYKNISGHLSLQIGSYLMILLFQFIIGSFFRFHIELLLQNSTTIENLEKERQGKLETESPFNQGHIINLQQVFGNNKLLWFFPMFGESGKPIGDGVIWHRNNTNSQINTQNSQNN